MIRTAIKFGLFVVLCTGLLVRLAVTIGNTTTLGLVESMTFGVLGESEETYELQARFDDVTGLLVNDNVKIAGVPVGKVTGISTDAGQALVRFQIRADYTVPDDSTISIRWRNLIGQRYLYVEPGTSATNFDDFADGDTPIGSDQTTNVVDLGELFDRLGPIVTIIDVNDVNEFLDSVTTALDGNEESISRTLDDLAFLVQRLGERDDAIGSLIDNLEVVARTVADRDAQIETMLDNLSLLSQTFSDNTDLLETALVEIGQFNTDLSSVLEVNRGEIDSILTTLDTTLNTIETNLDDVEIVVDNIDENAAATFRTSSYGTFLNQDIRCVAVVPLYTGGDPCALGEGGLVEQIFGPLTTTDPALLQPQYLTDGDALVALLGGTP